MADDDYVKLLFNAPEGAKAIETEALQTRIRSLFQSIVTDAQAPSRTEAERQEAFSSALSLQHAIDDLTIISVATSTALQVGRMEAPQTAPVEKQEVHPAWKKFCAQ